jgi:NitT/TauT family transport system ATP-binding protein
MRQPLKIVPSTASAQASPALHVAQLSKGFATESGPAVVLDRISFTVPAGQLVCVLGPSGCGKSTLLNIIAGFIPASSGSISMAGQPIEGPGPDRCVVFQEEALFPWLTAAENIGFGLRGRMRGKAAASEVKRFLALVGLSDFGSYLPRELSGGMKQRVALARVLILNPRVLLMDEPFGALDAQIREEMQELLLALWREFAHTILFVTHDLSEALVLADRIVVLDKNPGRISHDIPVPLSRPRKKESDSFHHFYRELHARLYR